MVSDIYRDIYDKMQHMGVLDIRQYAVIENPPFVPLCIDRLAEDVYALSQNPVIDGAVTANPDMEIRVHHDLRIAEPLVFQNGAVHRVVYPSMGKVDLKAKNELAAFLDNWLDELIRSGFILQK